MTQRVLVVKDEARIAGLVVKNLEAAGRVYTVAHAEDPSPGGARVVGRFPRTRETHSPSSA